MLLSDLITALEAFRPVGDEVEPDVLINGQEIADVIQAAARPMSDGHPVPQINIIDWIVDGMADRSAAEITCKHD